MLDTCKVVKKAKKGSHGVLGKHVTKLSTYSKLEYIPIEKRYRKVEICKIRRKSIETFVFNTKKVYRVNCGCYCQKRRQKNIMWTVLSPTVDHQRVRHPTHIILCTTHSIHSESSATDSEE